MIMRTLFLVFTIIGLASCKPRPPTASHTEGIRLKIDLLRPDYFLGEQPFPEIIEEFIRVHRPRKYWDDPKGSNRQLAKMIMSVSDCLGVDAHVLASMIVQESRFIIHAKNSGSNASGLTQFTDIALEEVLTQFGVYKDGKSRDQTIAYYRDRIAGKGRPSCKIFGPNFVHVWKGVETSSSMRYRSKRTNYAVMKDRLRQRPLHAILYGAVHLKGNVAKWRHNWRKRVVTSAELYAKSLWQYNGNKKERDAYWRDILKRTQRMGLFVRVEPGIAQYNYTVMRCQKRHCGEYVVVSNTANLRKTASTHHKACGALNYGDRVKVVMDGDRPKYFNGKWLQLRSSRIPECPITYTHTKLVQAVPYFEPALGDHLVAIKTEPCVYLARQPEGTTQCLIVGQTVVHEIERYQGWSKLVFNEKRVIEALDSNVAWVDSDAVSRFESNNITVKSFEVISGFSPVFSSISGYNPVNPSLNNNLPSCWTPILGAKVEVIWQAEGWSEILLLANSGTCKGESAFIRSENLHRIKEEQATVMRYSVSNKSGLKARFGPSKSAEPCFSIKRTDVVSVQKRAGSYAEIIISKRQAKRCGGRNLLYVFWTNETLKRLVEMSSVEPKYRISTVNANLFDSIEEETMRPCAGLENKHQLDVIWTNERWSQVRIPHSKVLICGTTTGFIRSTQLAKE